MTLSHTGWMARSTSPMNLVRSSGSCEAVRSVCTAIMPHPMSTPTAAGMTAFSVGITDPTVAPIPTCASGIRATWPARIGRRLVLAAWSSVLT